MVMPGGPLGTMGAPWGPFRMGGGGGEAMGCVVMGQPIAPRLATHPGVVVFVGAWPVVQHTIAEIVVGTWLVQLTAERLEKTGP